MKIRDMIGYEENMGEDAVFIYKGHEKTIKSVRSNITIVYDGWDENGHGLMSEIKTDRILDVEVEIIKV